MKNRHEGSVLTSWFYWREQSLFLNIQLQPRASRDEIVGVHGDYLKIRLTAPPIEGRANKYLIKFLSKCFVTPQERILVIKGELSRIKKVRIDRPKDTSAIEKILTTVAVTRRPS